MRSFCKFLLARSRQGHYASLDFLNDSQCEQLLRYALGQFDHPNHRSYWALAATLECLQSGRAVRYLEPGLGARLF